MKKIIAAFLCAVLASSLCACGSEKLAPGAQYKESEYSDAAVNDKVQLFIKQRRNTRNTK